MSFCWEADVTSDFGSISSLSANDDIETYVAIHESSAVPLTNGEGYEMSNSDGEAPVSKQEVQPPLASSSNKPGPEMGQKSDKVILARPVPVGRPSRPRFEHEPLKEKGEEIRILTILPNKSDNLSAPLECKIRHVSIEKARGYTALSYEWKTNVAKASILIHGATFAISDNLKHALLIMRHHGHEDMWVDAICINQRDEGEKSAQMKRMYEIYQQALEVAVWLGPAADRSNEIMDGLARISRTANHRLTLKELPAPAETEAIDKFLSRSYWERVWIVQEVAAGCSVQIYCGSKKVSWEYVAYLSDVWKEFRQGEGKLLLACTVCDIRASRIHYERKPKDTLQILSETRHSKATHDEDKVLGLLGLTSDWARYNTEIDCSQRPRDMCLSMTAGAITQSRSLDIILLGRKLASQKPFVRNGELLDNQRPLPSWCPDFVHFMPSRSEEAMISYLGNQGKRVFGKHRIRLSTTGSSTLRNVDFKLDLSAEVLQVRGLEIGLIKALGCAANEDAGHLNQDESEFQVRNRDDEAIYNALSRTLLMYDEEYDFYGESPTFLNWFTQGTYQSWFGEEDHRDVYSWFDNNEALMIHGKTMQERVEWGKKKWIGPRTFVRKVFELPQAVFQRRAQPISFFAEGHIVAAIRSALDEGLRLMTIDRHRRIGWATEGAMVNDKVFLLPGCTLPVILRPRANKGGYSLVGHAYVHGVMDNEVWSQVTSSQMLELVKIY
ncbi:uncharacterized protein Z518_07302 [Rhinocladiella mackenziei CBS 650.93]|uniref:Heterokaryon incompatibility domain-containing protein n=1 Tax=Rhinocladiella mackenziei CBS 650.93 TaxID=1442369 RepID=A0A0D2ID28_9EURO|nr:uncharacterized protein Z518_07302 [Rhinocladiella mackenziei CBS 650.93]KIX03749.1 hypothetical protein Z518_07302 [Rhinocladiella mackenziei CBS 650.93]